MSTANEGDRPLSQTATMGGLTRWMRRYTLQIGIVAVALVVWLLFLIGSPRTFLSPTIYIAFMSSTPYFAIMAIPLTLVVITGEIDLSFPSIMALGMAAFGLVFTATGSPLLGFIACLAAGLLAGYFNGFLVVSVGMPSLVATIGTQFLWRGVVLIVINGRGMGMSQIEDTLLHSIFVGKLFGVIPMQFVWTIIIAVVLWFFLNRHRFGAHVYLVGDNVESARLMGVNVGFTKTMTFCVAGVISAFSGFVVSAGLLYFWPTLGQGYLLNTLASVFLGGTSVFGGTGTIFGTFVGSFIIGAINAGIVASGLTGFWTQAIYGFIIVVSVSIQTLLGKRLR